MAHAKLAELAGWLTSIVAEGKREADYMVDARDLLNMIDSGPCTAPIEEHSAQPRSTGSTGTLAAPQLTYSFTVPATFVRFTVRAQDECGADSAARSLGEQVHDIDVLTSLGVEVTEISFADGSEIERDDSEAIAAPTATALLADDS
ncbi:hypothetical protein [Streptomyces echinatus]|uniref:hypothetical protein n=1 Tax=Streptomyces echinatus TaxID=67293 RepID=UPI0037A38447